MVGISSFWQIRVIDRPQMPACPGLAALVAATEKAIERPFAIKAKRLKRTTRPAISHDEFRPIAASLAYSIPRWFHGCVLSIARVPRSSSRAAAVVQPELSSCGAMSRFATRRRRLARFGSLAVGGVNDRRCAETFRDLEAIVIEVDHDDFGR
jgi:hypothetical protein